MVLMDGQSAGVTWNYDRAELLTDGIIHVAGALPRSDRGNRAHNHHLQYCRWRRSGIDRCLRGRTADNAGALRRLQPLAALAS
jgi:hypothetical protein